MAEDPEEDVTLVEEGEDLIKSLVGVAEEATEEAEAELTEVTSELFASEGGGKVTLNEAASGYGETEGITTDIQETASKGWSRIKSVGKFIGAAIGINFLFSTLNGIAGGGGSGGSGGPLGGVVGFFKNIQELIQTIIYVAIVGGVLYIITQGIQLL